MLLARFCNLGADGKEHVRVKNVRKLAIMPIVFYRYCISPLFPASCRFYPTCSTYAKEAILVHGVIRGGLLTLWRIVRCNPWNPGGYDPVPSAPQHPSDRTE